MKPSPFYLRVTLANEVIDEDGWECFAVFDWWLRANRPEGLPPWYLEYRDHVDGWTGVQTTFELLTY